MQLVAKRLLGGYIATPSIEKGYSMKHYIDRALALLADNGFKTFLCGIDLHAVIMDIVTSIECEVH